MFRFFLTITFVALLGISAYTHYNSQKTFEAKFKNIDGLPKGAPVTALGIKIGEVVGTRPANDGVIVTIRITRKGVSCPAFGSQLTITSFRPNQGRVLEIIPPSQPSETTSWIIQEPITTESWLHAALDLLEGLKIFSGGIIKYVTPENFELFREGFSEASASLNETAKRLYEYETNIIGLKEKLTSKSDEANELLVRLNKPIQALNRIVSDKDLTISLKNELGDFSQNLAEITKNINSPDFTTNLTNFKTMILDHLNRINTSLTQLDQNVTSLDLKQNIRNFNMHIENLNKFYEDLNSKDIKKIAKEAAKKAREATTTTARFKQN